MLNKIVGKVLFPNSPAWQQRRLANTAVIVLLVTITFAVILGGGRYYQKIKRI